MVAVQLYVQVCAAFALCVVYVGLFLVGQYVCCVCYVRDDANFGGI